MTDHEYSDAVFGLPLRHVVKAAEPELGQTLGRTVLVVVPLAFLLKPAASGERQLACKFGRADTVDDLAIVVLGPVETVDTGTTVPETPGRRNCRCRALPSRLIACSARNGSLLVGILLIQQLPSGTKAFEFGQNDRL